tara:strand:- start:7790 stop:8221 length:432 start_codon:yes stop_codon:yes gene_type:complete
MTIKNILQHKGFSIIAIDSKETVRDAVKTMDFNRIGALVVQRAVGACNGIFTERDVMRALATRDAPILDDPIKKHLTERPQTISPDTPVEEAMEIMTKRRFRHLPVMQNDQLSGIVSIGDLVNYRIHQTEREAEALKTYIRSG